jgi:hypothetical protein
MSAELLFESRLSYHVLRQNGAAEDAPFISLRLALTDGPIIYASNGAVVNASAWSMVIRRGSPAGLPPEQGFGTMRYGAANGKPACVIDIEQSPERFAALLDMFKGGHASEITVNVDDMVDKADYSKNWHTAAHPSIAIAAICFEFPLPQSEA